MATSNMKWKDTNGELYRYIDLSSVSRIDHTIGEVIEINSTDAPSRAQKIVNKNDIIFATTRPTLQRYALIDDDFAGQIASTGYCVMRAKTSEVLPKWLYFNIAKTDFNNYTEKNQEGSAYPAISDSKVKAFKIPVPPLEVQGRIVSILDKFDSLVNSISDGLPAEINSRRQQYEFYRTKLLTFQELNL
jgi:type I restriction enzyme S subunit